MEDIPREVGWPIMKPESGHSASIAVKPRRHPLTRRCKFSCLPGFILGFLWVGASVVDTDAAFAADRTLLLPTAPDQAAPILAITADAADAFTVYLASGQMIRFDSNHQPVLNFAHPDLAAPWPASGSFEAGSHPLGPLVINGSAFGSTLPGLSGDACRVHPLDDGSILTLLAPSQQLTRQRDVGGGLWDVAQHRGLVRYAANCSTQVLPLEDSWGVSQLIAHPQQSAAVVLTYSGEVRLAIPQGIVWDLALPQFAEYAAPWRETIRNGFMDDGKLVIAYRAGDESERLAVVDEQGRLAWTWRAEDGRDLLVVQPYQSGVLLVTDNAVIFLDTQGREVWRRSAPTDWWPLIAQARSDDPYFWLQHSTPNSDQATIAAFRLTNGARTEWQVDGALLIKAGRADGSVIVHDMNASWQETDPLLLARPDGSLELLMPELVAEQTVRALHRDEHGVLAAAMGLRSSTLHALSTDLRPRWSITRYAEGHGPDAGLQVAANADQACLLADPGSGAQRLECFDRTSGASLFEPLSWDGYASKLNPIMDQRIEVVHQSAYMSGILVRRSFGLDGSPIELHEDLVPGVEPSERWIHDVLHSPAGHTVVYYSDRDLNGGLGAEQLIIVAPGHEPGVPLVTLNLTDPAEGGAGQAFDRQRRFALTHDQLAILSPTITGQLSLTVHDLDSGSKLWQQEPFTESFQSEFHLQAAGTDWMVASFSPEQFSLSRLASQDGEIVLEVQHPISHQIRRRGSHWRLDDVLLVSDPETTAIVSRRPGGTRVLWFDNDSGELLASAMHPLITHEPLTWLAAGPSADLILAGRASEQDWPAPALAQLSMASRKPAEDPAVESFAGVWFNAATTGQGWLIDVIDGVDKIFGAWFTFSDWPASDAGGLRWYTMLGDTPGPDGVASLKLYQNACGSFEAGPPTQSEQVGRVHLWQTSSGGLQMRVDWLWDPGSEWEQIGDSMPLDLSALLPPSQTGGIQHWFDPATAGQGLLLGRPLEDKGPLVAAWFTYDLPGAANDLTCQHWFTAIGPSSGDAYSGREARLLQTLGGSLDGRPTRNTVEIGQIRLTTFEVNPSGCDTLLFEYQFDQTDLAGPYAGLSGWRLLQTATPCRTP